MTDDCGTLREQVLKLDDYRCQITGADGRTDPNVRAKLEVHHDERRGMGGVPSRDAVANCITLLGEIHRWEHEGAIEIKRWDRDGGVLDVVDHKNVLGFGVGPVPNEQLWFYAGRLVEDLRAAEGRIQGLHAIDGEVARDVWRLWKDDHWKLLDGEMKSFAQYAGARGWDVRRAGTLARLYDKAVQLQLQWPEKATAADFRRELRNAGHVEDRAYWHVAFRDLDTLLRLIDAGDVSVVRCSDDDFADSGATGLKVGRWFRIKAGKGGGPVLSGVEGGAVPYTEARPRGGECGSEGWEEGGMPS